MNSQFPVGHQVHLADLAHNPYPMLRRLQQEEPVSWIDELGLWFVTRRADIVDILLDPSTFTVASPESLLEDTIGATMLSTDGKAQQRLRQPFAGPFLPKPVRSSMTTVVSDTAHRLIDAFIADGQADLRSQFADPLALFSVTTMLGLPIHDFAAFRAWFTAIADALGNFQKDPQLRRKGQTAAAEFGKFASACLADESNISLLRDAVQPNGLNSNDVIAAARVIIFGGLETTAALILNAVWALHNHPHQFAAVRSDVNLLEAVVEETLRWEPPVQTCTRHVTRPITVRGTELAAGDTVQCMIGAANRDPDHFSEPDQFDIKRGNARDHLSFGLGKHFCMGAALARLEGEIALRTLFERLPHLRLNPERPAAPHGHEFRSPPNLSVCWDVD